MSTFFNSNGMDNLGLPDQSIPLIDVTTGKISRYWWPFFNTLYQRVGGPIAPSNSVLAQSIANTPKMNAGVEEGNSEEVMLIPGPPGIAGVKGAMGLNGFDGEDGQDAYPIPGPVGPQGVPGPTGAQGPSSIIQFATDDYPFDVLSEAISIIAPQKQLPGGYLTNSALTVPITSGTTTNITSIALPPGTWNVQATFSFNPAGTTVLSQQVGSVSTTSATLGSFGQYYSLFSTQTTGDGSIFSTPLVRLVTTTIPTTTIFAVVNGTFSVSTCTANGIINAWPILPGG